MDHQHAKEPSGTVAALEGDEQRGQCRVRRGTLLCGISMGQHTRSEVRDLLSVVAIERSDDVEPLQEADQLLRTDELAFR